MTRYTKSRRPRDHKITYIIYYIFAKLWPIFKILSLVDSRENLEQTCTEGQELKEMWSCWTSWYWTSKTSYRFIVQYTKWHKMVSCGSFFNGDFRLKCFQETSAKELTEASRYSNLAAHSSCWLMLFFIWFTDRKICSHELQWKKWRIAFGTAKNKALDQIRVFRAIMTSSKRQGARWNWATPVWYSSIMESQSTKPNLILSPQLLTGLW